jgi:hypothetical protein
MRRLILLTLFAEEIEDLLLEARNYLDGEPIANEEQANAVSSLAEPATSRVERCRRSSQGREEAARRRGEGCPGEVAPILDKADLAASTAKQALAPWLAKVEAQSIREAEIARRKPTGWLEIAAEAPGGSWQPTGPGGRRTAPEGRSGR